MTEKKNYCDKDGKCTGNSDDSHLCCFSDMGVFSCLHRWVGYTLTDRCTSKQARAEAVDEK